MSRYVVDIIKDVVTEVSSSYSGTVYYLYGHPVEVVNTLKEKTRSSTAKFQKYPLIVLFQDFEEEKGDHMIVDSKVRLNLIICTNTKPSYKSSERYTYTFKNILYPIYELFIQKLIDSGDFRDLADGLVPHTKIDRVYWGKTGLYANEGNVFDDYLDAIEIKDLELEVLTNKNC